LRLGGSSSVDPINFSDGDICNVPAFGFAKPQAAEKRGQILVRQPSRAHGTGIQ
jgi:hypothetical protein